MKKIVVHLGEAKEYSLGEYINQWLCKIEDKLPYSIGDKRLAIGSIPIGTVEPDIENISANKYIHSIEAIG